ncbi:MAG: hypothetical protein QNK24_15985, partial [Desulfuromusa sp.]|nr:hypothetical protein [Desulfuromusa sp.]
MIPQSTFMIMANILPDREDQLRSLLASMNMAPGMANPKNDLIPFYQFKQLHVARFAIIRANSNEDIARHGIEPETWSPRLAFLGDIDGDPDLFLAELALRADQGLRKIFSHCQNFDVSDGTLLAWLRENSLSPSANYINWRGRSVAQIREEMALSEALNLKLTEINASSDIDDPIVLHDRLQKFVKDETASLRLRLSPQPPTPAGWWLRNFVHLLCLPLFLILLSPILLVGLPFYLFYLRRLENSDPDNSLRADREHVRELKNQEDIDVTNHFNVFGQVKPGRFRNYTLRFLLWVLDYASRHVYHCGFLARVQTIHFARWVLLDNNK